jgi:hypothetical protein
MGIAQHVRVIIIMRIVSIVVHASAAPCLHIVRNNYQKDPVLLTAMKARFLGLFAPFFRF